MAEDQVRDAAAIARDEAMARKFSAEADWYSVKAQAEDVQRLQNLAELRISNANADVAEANRDVMNIQREIEMATHYHHLFFPFNADVSEKTVSGCINQMTIWQRTRPGQAIEVQFNSPGGSVVDGLALFDFLQTLRVKGHRLTTSTIGIAASMAAVLLQAGDERVMGRSATLLIHQVSAGAMGRFTEMEDHMTWLAKMQNRLVAILAERSTLSENEIREKWERRDWWLTAEEALELGFIDTIR